MSSILTLPTHDLGPRRLRLFMLAMYLPVAVIFAAIYPETRDLGEAPDAIKIMLVLLTVYITGMCVLVNISMTGRVEIDRNKAKVSRIYSLFGRTVRRVECPLSEYDKVSLHRAYRGGYVAALVGHEREFVLGWSWDLKVARKKAEDAASYCSFALKDQI